MQRVVITVGQRFGRLIAVKEMPKTAQGRRQWQFSCDCGTAKYVARIDHVRGGLIVSCGCHRKAAVAAAVRVANTTHGMTKTPEFKAWDAMLQRCLNPKNFSYSRYGGRGITVCKRWRSFENFYKDMGPRPHSKLSIHRIDNDKGYFPKNCKWATRAEQYANRTDAWITRRANIT